MQDQKSIFGIVLGLVALFCFWLWASGKYAAFLALATGTAPASTATGAAATSTNGSTGGPLAASSGGSSGSVTIPNYVNTSPLATALAAIQSSPAYNSSLGGYTTTGAVGGGTQVTPTVLANSTSIPTATVAAGNNGDWLASLLAGFGATGTQATAATNPTTIGSNGTLDPVTGLAQGGV